MKDSWQHAPELGARSDNIIVPQKVAKIIGNTFKALEQRGISIDGAAEKVDERIAALVASGRLDTQGNIKRWRYSEVRLPNGRAEAEVAFEPV